MEQTITLPKAKATLIQVPIRDLKRGDIVLWDYGYKSKILAVTPYKAGATFIIKEQSLETGRIAHRKLKAEQYVAMDCYSNW